MSFSIAAAGVSNVVPTWLRRQEGWFRSKPKEHGAGETTSPRQALRSYSQKCQNMDVRGPRKGEPFAESVSGMSGEGDGGRGEQRPEANSAPGVGSTFPGDNRVCYGVAWSAGLELTPRNAIKQKSQGCALPLPFQKFPLFPLGNKLTATGRSFQECSPPNFPQPTPSPMPRGCWVGRVQNVFIAI